jgi:hypothetical protein
VATAIVQSYSLAAVPFVQQDSLLEDRTRKQLSVDQFMIQCSHIPTIFQEVVVLNHGTGLLSFGQACEPAEAQFTGPEEGDKVAILDTLSKNQDNLNE